MPKLIDLTGKTFNRLTVLKRAEKNTSTNRPQWECKCSCGNSNIIIVAGNHLRTGHTQFCGCLQKEAARKNNFKDITNQKFGLLVAKTNVGSNSQGSAMWECQCSCGNKIIVRGMDLRNGHTSSCGCLNSKGEQKIIEILIKNNVIFTTQKIFKTCKFIETGAYAKFDFYINNEYLIEYDGKQHYEAGFGEDLEIVQKRDNYKNQWCKDNNIPLIRIPYTHYDNLCIEDLLLETSKYRVI